MNISGIRATPTLCLLAALLGGLSGGCASTANDLTMVSADHHRDFRQHFSHAFAALNPDGDYDVVLVHDANADSLAGSEGPVKSSLVTPRQVVHIRVYWLADHGMKIDHPVASNATIDWFLYGDRPNEGANVLEYSGGGLVLVSESGNISTVTVRQGFLKPVARRGGMTDPLGPSSLVGTITARVDRHGVQDVLKEVNDADGAAAQTTAAPVAAGQ